MGVDYDLIGMHVGPPLRIHPPAWCAGEPCAVHNPSDHPLNARPLNWRGHVMERVCTHGRGHPDPDDAAWRRRQGRPVFETHDCDGCCTGTPDRWPTPTEPDRVFAPWNQDQTASLNLFQVGNRGRQVPYLCPHRDDGQHPTLGSHPRGILIAISDGWVCPAGCGHTQAWAHRMATDWSWRLDDGI